MLVKEAMTKKVVTIEHTATVFDACMLYREKKVGCLVVVDGENCVGIVTERDLIERSICMRRDPEKTLVKDIMSSDIKTVHSLDHVDTALEIMTRYHIKKLPVVMDNKIVGIITVTDISKTKSDLSKRFIESWVKPTWKD
ncbi:MAG: CBS domain-containing protein [Candidatus Thermoplasmatota archaeon]